MWLAMEGRLCGGRDKSYKLIHFAFPAGFILQATRGSAKMPSGDISKKSGKLEGENWGRHLQKVVGKERTCVLVEARGKDIDTDV